MIDSPTEAIWQTATRPKHPADTAFPTIIPDPSIIERAGKAGQRTLWVVFFLMIIATLLFVILSRTVPASKRLYHYITTLITIIAALSYFAMATHSGITWHHSRIREHHDHVPDTFRHVHRPIYYARYIDWALTTPLLILDLSLLSGLNGASIFTAITADIIMILTGLFAAFGHTRLQTWGWYTFACIAYLVVVWQLVASGRKFAAAKGANVSKFYNAIMAYTLILWAAYPIVWAISHATHRLTVNSEIIAYAVLDVLAKGVFGAWLLFTHKRLAETNVELTGFWTHGFSSEGRIRVGDDDEGA